MAQIDNNLPNEANNSINDPQITNKIEVRNRFVSENKVKENLDLHI